LQDICGVFTMHQCCAGGRRLASPGMVAGR